MSGVLDRYVSRVESRQPWCWRGQIVESLGQTIESIGPVASVGERARLKIAWARDTLPKWSGFEDRAFFQCP